MYPNTNNNFNNFNNCFCFKSYVRILHAVVDAPSVDVYANEMMIASNLKYGEFSKYVPFLPGDYNFVVYASGKPSIPLIELTVTIGKNTAYTMSLAGKMPNKENLNVFMVAETKEVSPITRMAAIRFTNLCPESPALDIVSQDGTILFSDVKYGVTTENVAVPPGVYTFYLKAADTENTILTIPNIEIQKNTYYSMFSIGIYGGMPNIELMIPEDGLNNLDLC